MNRLVRAETTSSRSNLRTILVDDLPGDAQVRDDFIDGVTSVAHLANPGDEVVMAFHTRRFVAAS